MSEPAALAAGSAPLHKRWWFRVAGSVSILALLIWLLPTDLLLESLGRLPWWAALGALGTYLCLHLIGTLKWRMMLATAGASLTVGQAVTCYYAGLFGNTFLPSVVGGDVVRLGLATRYSRRTGAVVLGSVIDRTLDMLGLALVAAVGTALLPSALDEQGRRVFLGLALLGAVFGTAGLLALRLLPFGRLPWKIRRRVVSLRRSFAALRDRPSRMILSLGAGMLLQSSLVVLNFWLGTWVGVEASLAIWLVVWPLAKLSAALPVSQGGLGVREAALVALFAPFGVTAVAAVAAGLLFQAVILSGGLVGGLGAWLAGAWRGGPSR